MANKDWLKQAASYKQGAEVESHKTLQWQGARYKPGERATTPQKCIMNTRFIYPAAGGRGVKKP